MGKTTDIAQLGLIAVIGYFLYKFLNKGSEIVKDTFEAVYKSGQETGTNLGNWWNETVTYPQFAVDTITKWTSQGYVQYGNQPVTWTEKNQVTNELLSSGLFTVTSQATHAGTVPFEQDTWLVFIKPLNVQSTVTQQILNSGSGNVMW